MDHTEEFVWRGDGDEAEVVVYAPDEETARRAFKRALVAAKLPGAESPVYAAATPADFGCVAASSSHAAPDLVSVPTREILLIADTPASNLGMPPEEVMGFIRRALAEAGPAFRLNASGVRRMCEYGANAAAEDGVIEEEDLRFLTPFSGDADALGRRAVSAGERDWDDFSTDISPFEVTRIFDADGAEALGLEPGMFAIEVRVGVGDLGRIAFSMHRERITSRVRSGEFDSFEDLPAAPLETEEAYDLLAATRNAANFADGRAALCVHALRRTLREVAGRLEVRAAWRSGGVEGFGDGVVHRRGLAEAGEGKVLVSGGVVAVGTGTMYASVPPFGVFDEDGRRPWEEAGLLERWVELNFFGGDG